MERREAFGKSIDSEITRKGWSTEAANVRVVLSCGSAIEVA